MDLEEALAQADVYAEETEVCKIDNDLRTITVPSGLQTVGVESDEDVRRLNFQMPKQYGEVDLSEFNIRINFLNANNSGDVYAVTDKAVSGDNITFSWLVGRNALAYRGSIRFIVCLKKTDAEGVVRQEFNTTVAQLTVLEGLETTEQVIQENPDIIEQILQRLDELEENGGGGGGTGTSNYNDLSNKPSINGVTLSGNKTSEDLGISAKMTQVDHGNLSDTTFQLPPNQYHTWGEVSSLTLTLGAEISGQANAYWFSFDSGDTATTLSLPEEIKTDIVVEANTHYECIIIGNYMTFCDWEVTT